MPVYEFKCEECGRRFDLVASLAEKESGLKPECPKCGSANCTQVFGRVNIVTTSKSDRDFDNDFGAGDDFGGGDDAGLPDDGLGDDGFGGDSDLDDLD
ncbi:MAG: zinc ribbon domain-containing protein [bacterium]